MGLEAMNPSVTSSAKETLVENKGALVENKAMIECRGVWKVFGPAKEAIKAMASGELSKAEVFKRYGCSVGVADANIQVKQGEIFCIMGLSGSGKSTLLRHINRLIEPTKGEISIDGERIDQMSPAQLRQMRNHKIAMVFQHVALLPHRTVADNTAFGLEARGLPKADRRRRAMEKLELVGLDQWADRYPRELSGGMQQRVGLARALTSDPSILLLDEPFSALDPVIRRDLQDQFLTLAHSMQKTAVFITHDLEEAMKLGTRLAIMRDARIVQVGKPEEILFAPADSYVRDFVRGISRQLVLKAANVMQPLDTTDARAQASEATARAHPNERLDALISRIADKPGPIVVYDDDKAVGVISVSDFLRAIKPE
jgi:glycine betaine/proline transport system ATP-binding protein